MSDAINAIRRKRALLHKEYKQFKQSNFWDRITEYLALEAAAQREEACREDLAPWQMSNARAMARALKRMQTMPRDVFDVLDASYAEKEEKEKEEQEAEQGVSTQPIWGTDSDSDSDPL